jgi:hypothetical protein
MWYVIRIDLNRYDDENRNEYASATIVGRFANNDDATEVARILNLSDNDCFVMEDTPAA